jgi:hypothetical protein
MLFSRQIQPLWRQRTKTWTYPGPNYPDRPSSEELSVIEVEAQIHKVLDLGVNPTPVPAPSPYGEGSLVLGLVL